MIKKIDLRGLPCPQPVLQVKRLLDDKTIEAVEALVDDEICVENLKRLARSASAFARGQALGSHFQVAIKRKDSGQPEDMSYSQEQATGRQRKKNTVIFLAKDTFGQGDQDFSASLLNLFLQSMLEAGHEIQAILLANSGVKLMAPDSPALKVLKDFQVRGCQVLACGLCLEYYGLKQAVPAEQITNMFAIVEYLMAADKVLTP